jgi:hypothetical protein
MAQDAPLCNSKSKNYLGSQISPVFSTPVRAAKPSDFWFLGTARAFKSDSITEGRISIKAPESVQDCNLRKP